jgi:hypothetical protein
MRFYQVIQCYFLFPFIARFLKQQLFSHRTLLACDQCNKGFRFMGTEGYRKGFVMRLWLFFSLGLRFMSKCCREVIVLKFRQLRRLECPMITLPLSIGPDSKHLSFLPKVVQAFSCGQIQYEPIFHIKS